MTSSSLEYVMVVGMSGQISCVVGLGLTKHIYVCVDVFFSREVYHVGEKRVDKDILF